jgi:Kef-type K+ transport system membrane component KefB/nucleotide-binding universal stress UspA family protein
MCVAALHLPHPLIGTVASDGDERVVIFFVQIALLIGVGRLLGELMQRIGQPSVMGQLLAGILLGPSIFGAIAPDLQQTVFPVRAGDRQMLKAVSELGVLLLLLLTGMETDLALVKRVRKTATFISLGGIVIPFACGYGLGEFLPDSLLPDPGRRLFTSLFLAVALSISSVKIVAAVLREVDFLRRDLGQVILAAAITDDVVGWTALAFIGGISAHGKVVLGPVVLSVCGTIVFLVVCFTLGHRWVARVIRWTNDRLVSEVPVLSLIVVLMIALALLTNVIGVHTVLGAFVAGVMIGESPILTRHIEEQLRGVVVALFMPVFFGVAGLSIDLKLLADPRMLGLAGLFIGIASIGKLGGCYLGSRLARLHNAEALAIGVGMNARGSTEIILATIGLTMGVLNASLFTMIVVMAAVTTLCMPPALRWALRRVPLREEEKARLEAEAAEEKDLMPKVERVLVALDQSDNARLAANLAGCLIGARHLAGTVIDLGHEPELSAPARAVLDTAEASTQAVSKQASAATRRRTEPTGGTSDPAPEPRPIRELVSVVRPKDTSATDVDAAATAILEEAQNGYGLLIIGLDAGHATDSEAFQTAVGKIVHEFKGHVAILVHAPRELAERCCDKILVPTTGADYSRFGSEVAIAIAKGCGGTITALHVSAPPAAIDLLRRPKKLQRPARALLDDIVALGEREGVRVTSRAMIGVAKESEIVRQARRGGHRLIVLGTKAWSGEELHFGRSAEAIIDNAPGPILVVKT